MPDEIKKAQVALTQLFDGLKRRANDPISNQDMYNVLVALLNKMDTLTPEIADTQGYTYRTIENTAFNAFSNTRYNYSGSVIYVDRIQWADSNRSFNMPTFLRNYTLDKTYSIRLDVETKDPIYIREGDIIHVNHFDRIFLSKAIDSCETIRLVILSEPYIDIQRTHLPFIYDDGIHLLHRPAKVDVNGYIYSRQYVDEKTLKTLSYDWTGAVTGQGVWVPSGYRFYLTDYVIAVSAAITVTLFDHTDDLTHRVGKYYFAANGGVVENLRKVFRASASNNLLKITTTGGNGSITCRGWEDV